LSENFVKQYRCPDNDTGFRQTRYPVGRAMVAMMPVATEKMELFSSQTDSFP
jgi:hypothetical protein